MHDIDRTNKEMPIGEMGYEGFEMEQESFGAQEFESEFGELTNEFSNEGFEFEGEAEMGEMMEMELATELLEVQSEAELENFLGNLIKKASGAIGGFIRSPQGKALGGMFKGLAKKALPFVGKAVGTYFGGPAGAAVGGKLGSMASNLFEMELEGMSREDQEFEMAKQFVKFANSATRSAIRTPAAGNPGLAARKAIVLAARKHAPGILKRCSCGKPFYTHSHVHSSAAVTPVTSTAAPSFSPVSNIPGRSGRWYRKGRSIILMGM
jgi:uncharacterized protein (DUF697 family)